MSTKLTVCAHSGNGAPVFQKSSTPNLTPVCKRMPGWLTSPGPPSEEVRTVRPPLEAGKFRRHARVRLHGDKINERKKSTAHPQRTHSPQRADRALAGLPGVADDAFLLPEGGEHLIFEAEGKAAVAAPPRPGRNCRPTARPSGCSYSAVIAVTFGRSNRYPPPSPMSNHVSIHPDAAAPLAEWLQQRSPSAVAVFTDHHTHHHCYPLLASHLPPHVVATVPAGEIHKTLDTCQTLWRFMTEHRLDRHALVLNLGGGVLGDMGGFCAATYKRGVDFVQLPTTLLAQVDAAVGGKLGVDFMGFKNHVGVFAPPAAVFIGTDFLRTLPAQQVRSGFAEVIKHCLIADGAAWDELRQTPFRDHDLLPWVRHSVALKQAITQRDPRERGERKLLNFGHTVGHAVESHFLTRPHPLLHGEAVAVGMWCEAYLSARQAGLTAAHFQAIAGYLHATYPRVPLTAADVEAIVPLTLQDKKNRGGQLLTVLLDAPGRARYDCPLTLDDTREALQAYASS